MQISFPSVGSIVLAISDEPDGKSDYPTRQLMKGILMSAKGVSLAEEAVGFGVPVIKRGVQTYFPGAMTLHRVNEGADPVIVASYSVNWVEKMAKNGTEMNENNLLYSAKNLLAATIRNIRLLRKPLTNLSSALRSRQGWETVYAPASVDFRVDVTFSARHADHALEVSVDLSHLESKEISEIVIMNEQGGAAFDLYQDSTGDRLKREQIGPWDEVRADHASFQSSTYGTAFSLNRMPGVKLYRGRELIGQRLAWSGFGYSIPSGVRSFHYTISLEETS